MGIFGNKSNPNTEQTFNRCLYLVYYTIDRLSLVVNYHRILYTGAASNLGMLLTPSKFPGTEQFKFKVQMMEKMRNQVKDLPQSHTINFDHLANMQVMDDTLKNVLENINGVMEIYGDDLCVDFDEDLIAPEHLEILDRLFGECVGLSEALNAEIDKLESEYYLLRGAFDTIIPQERWDSFNGMFKTIMDLRYKP